MKRCRRGMLLNEVVMLLPIIAAIGTVGYQVTTRALHFQARAARQIACDDRLQDVLRRLQRDAGAAAGARLEKDGAGGVLTLSGAELTGPSSGGDAAGRGDIEYRVSAGTISRIQGGTRFEWSFADAGLELALEAVQGRPRLVWLTWTSRVPSEQGPLVDWRMAAAALIGRGGGA